MPNLWTQFSDRQLESIYKRVDTVTREKILAEMSQRQSDPRYRQLTEK